MKLQMKIVFKILFTMLILFINFSTYPSLQSTENKLIFNQESEIVIYTYESLMADPYFDIEANFSADSGIHDVKIIRFDDANELVSRLVAEKDQPVADVVIGIDNALINLVDKEDILQMYSPSVIDELDKSLIDNLDPDGYLWPYDYGVISLFYQNQIVNKTTDPILENFTLETLLESNILSKLIIQNPKYSSTGLGFLLWTIAVYGDSTIGLDGLLKSNWRDFWVIAGKKVNITKSWGDAFTIFFEPKEGKPIMSSYGSSPAYGYCLYEGDNSTSALISNENGEKNGWLQIEGIGLVKNAPHDENGKKFIDWFLSAELQSEIPISQWMHPANTNADIAACFQESSIDPKLLKKLNDLIPPEILKFNLKNWIDQWEITIVNKEITYGFDFISLAITSIFIGALIVNRKKFKDN